MKSWFSGIFGFFFSRAVVAFIGFAVILLLILLPFFKTQMMLMLENEAKTFSNSTLSATSSDLYTNSYGEVVEYLNKVLSDTENILFVVISDATGKEILISKDEWHLYEKKFGFNQAKLDSVGHVLYFENNNPVTQVDCFIYHQSIVIGGTPWGVMTVGMSDKEYQFIKDRYSLIVKVASSSLVLILSLLFYNSSKTIRKEVAQLSKTGLELQNGNLSARAPEEAVGEIGTLSKAINTMAINLESQTRSTKQLTQIVEQTNDAFILFDSTLQILFVNDAISEVTGYSAPHFHEETMAFFSKTLKLDSVEIKRKIDWMLETNQRTATQDVVITNSALVPIDTEIRIERIASKNNKDPNFLIVMSNITTRKNLEKELHRLAFYDKLTDLPNRRMFMDSLRKTIASCKRKKTSFALFFMDLDNFKLINDTLGHVAGDEFLVHVGNRLTEIFRSNDIVTRLGGDEFTILIEDVKGEAYVDIGQLADKLVTELSSEPININGRSLSISTSLGVAVYPQNGEDSETLLKNADIAMYSAKKSGKNRYEFFSEEMTAVLRYHMQIESDLKEAIVTDDQITCYYQPIVNLTTNKLVGVEALARWQHPKKGFIPPSEFIKVAEGSDLILSLSEYLLNNVFKQMSKWRDQSFLPQVSVNISARQFEKPNFIDYLVNLLNKYELDAKHVQLEFTENVMLDTTEETIVKFKKLRKLGFKIAIDDFGTGYSSLGYMHKLPIDVIKIDRSFVNAMMDNKKSNAIVAAILTLSNTLEIKTIAEGIEQHIHVEKLKSFKCDYGQGYLFDRALPVHEFDKKYITKNQCLRIAS